MAARRRRYRHLYRKGRALTYYNKMVEVAKDIQRLKPEMLTWVPHIAQFVVPRQMVALGDPTRRSCDACESFGAMVKKIIKHTTCRRRTTEAIDHKGKGKTKAKGKGKKRKAKAEAALA